MDIQAANKAVEHIRSIADDEESAHGYEDQLRERFIEHVASLNLGELSEVAKIVLSINDIEFARWCA